MAETWVKTRFSKSLSGRSARDTKPELLLRRALHALGFRFRLHRRIGERLTVDILMPRHRVAVFADGCFWHGHGCERGGGRPPRGPNATRWAAKRARVKEREARANELLTAIGYRVVRLWECVILADPAGTATTLARIALQPIQSQPSNTEKARR
jgi:DNA mismatch endonuclease (patch repair protein)